MKLDNKNAKRKKKQNKDRQRERKKNTCRSTSFFSSVKRYKKKNKQERFSKKNHVALQRTKPYQTRIVHLFSFSWLMPQTIMMIHPLLYSIDAKLTNQFYSN